jgi:chemotaxis protein MotC
VKWPVAAAALFAVYILSGLALAEEKQPDSGEAKTTATYDGPPGIIRDIRSIFALQDAVAAGHASAIGLQKSMLTQVGKKLLGHDMSSHADGLAPGVAGYVLSGGDPGVAEKLAGVSGLKPQNVLLLKGAALYMRSKREEAATEWKSLDLAELPPTLAGRVALAKAMLAGTDLKEKQQLLRISIALLPGSLVEESALRRSALAYAESGEEHQFWMRSERYLRRFSRSLYAPEFMFDLTGTIVAMTKAGKNPNLARLDLLLGRVSIENRRKLYLALARDASAHNLGQLSQFAARRLRRLSLPESVESEIAEVYDWIFDAASQNAEMAAKRLRGIESRHLPKREQKLLAAALAITEQIMEPATMAPDIAEPVVGQPLSALEQRAALTLTEVDAALAEAMQ